MAISFPAPEAAAQRPQVEAGQRDGGSSIVANIAYVVRRGYERVSSAIFDPDGDCVRF